MSQPKNYTMSEPKNCASRGFSLYFYSLDLSVRSLDQSLYATNAL